MPSDMPETILHAFEHDTEVEIPAGWSRESWEKALTAAYHLRHGRTIQDTAARLGVSRQALFLWRKKPGWAEAERMVDRSAIHRMKGLALDGLRELLVAPGVDNKTRLAAARFVLERTDANFVDPKLKLGFDEGTQTSTMADFDGMDPDDLRALLRMVRSGVPVAQLVAAARNTITVDPEEAIERAEEDDRHRARRRRDVYTALSADQTLRDVSAMLGEDYEPADLDLDLDDDDIE